MTAPLPAIRLTGVHKSIPSGYVLGRVSAGVGDVQLIRHTDLASALLNTGQVVGPGTQEWQAGSITAVDTAEIVESGTTLTLANRTASTLMGNPGTAAAKPSDVAIGANLTLSSTGTLSASSGSTGTVTNVATSGAGISGGPITTTGTITVEWNGGTVTVIDPSLTVSGGTIAVAGTYATKSYVDNSIASLNPNLSAVVATTGALPANTYANGSSGVGATLTANANGALTVDGFTPALLNYILVKDEATQAHNGLYEYTQLGDTSHPYILTRASTFNQLSNVNGPTLPINVKGGTANANTAWLANSVVATMGTDAITFVEFGLWQAAQVTAVDGTTIVNSSGTLSAASTGAALRRLFSAVVPVGNPSNTTEDTLQSYTLPANTLATNGQAVRIIATGTFAANTHSRTARVYFDTASVNMGPTSSVNDIYWNLEMMVFRTGASTQSFWAKAFCYTGGFLISTTVSNGFVSGASGIAANLASPVTIKVTGQTGTAAANDVVCDQMLVEFLP